MWGKRLSQIWSSFPSLFHQSTTSNMPFKSPFFLQFVSSVPFYFRHDFVSSSSCAFFTGRKSKWNRGKKWVAKTLLAHFFFDMRSQTFPHRNDGKRTEGRKNREDGSRSFIFASPFPILVFSSSSLTSFPVHLFFFLEENYKERFCAVYLRVENWWPNSIHPSVTKLLLTRSSLTLYLSSPPSLGNKSLSAKLCGHHKGFVIRASVPAKKQIDFAIMLPSFLVRKVFARSRSFLRIALSLQWAKRLSSASLRCTPDYKLVSISLRGIRQKAMFFCHFWAFVCDYLSCKG